MLTLYGYWRSGTSYRTRIALNIKGVAYTQLPVNLRAGEQRHAAFEQLNPQRLVPALRLEDAVLTQSPAILEWLEECHPQPPLLPADPEGRAHVRAMAAAIGCDIHPLNNLRVLEALRTDFTATPDQEQRWIARWIGEGFTAVEAMIAQHGKGFAYGDRPTLADCYLVPQLYSAERFGVDCSAWPRLVAAAEAARALQPFADAHPDNQPDAVRP
ncbi:maleylacetoacetate isomerase [Novosphingobium terrae]|uniref:maleylacetoacetate isomerase n=1 Tax=Novosphingobium terrae TaxID=2726189 RepID=UPI00197D0891|nr:maleylacetoacetate isomerase [Novosphingobium terrae]